MIIKVNNYVLTDSKIIDNKKILIISDVHSNVKALKRIRNLLDTIKPSYILMPGDTLDRVDDPNNKKLSVILKDISYKYNLIICLGNHEFYDKYNLYDRNSKNKSLHYLDLFKYLDKNSNSYTFSKSFCFKEFGSFNLYSINLPYEYYSEGGEDFNILYDILDKNKDKVKNDKFNILLIHSPNGLFDKDNINTSNSFISSMNLIVCGHNHGGLVPTNIQDKVKSHRGFVGPYGTILPRNSFGIYNKDNTSLIISNGVTKMSYSTKTGVIGKFINLVCEPEIDLIELKHGYKHVLELKNRNKYKF